MTTDPTKTVKLFFCYAREDKASRDELEKHLSLLKHQKQITTWCDREISPGSEWEKEIDTHLDSAHIILLLISPDFMASDYCYGIEMKRALERHEKGTTHVTPIILRPVNYEDTPFSSLPMILPTNAKPITTWPNRDRAYSNIAEDIRKVTLEILAKQWRDQGDSWRAQVEYEQALAAYEQAIRFNASDTMSYVRKGRVLVNLRRFEEAVATFKQALKLIDEAIILDPKKSENHYNRGGLLVQLGKIEDGKIEDFLEYDNFDDDYNYHKDYLLAQLEQYEKALEAFNEAINLGPTKAEFHYYRGGLLIQLEQNKKSLVAYDRDIFLDPEYNKEVLAAYDRAIRLDPKQAKYHYDRGEILVQLKRNKEALAAFDQAINLHPTNKQYTSTKDDLLKALKQYEKDLATIDEAMSLDNENIQSHYKRGHLLVQLERYEEALTAFDQGIHLELSKQEEDITCQYLSNLPSLYETYATKIEICEKLIQQTRNEMEKHSNLF